jgi:hypothetical protein
MICGAVVSDRHACFKTRTTTWESSDRWRKIAIARIGVRTSFLRRFPDPLFRILIDERAVAGAGVSCVHDSEGASLSLGRLNLRGTESEDVFQTYLTALSFTSPEGTLD